MPDGLLIEQDCSSDFLSMEVTNFMHLQALFKALQLIIVLPLKHLSNQEPV